MTFAPFLWLVTGLAFSVEYPVPINVPAAPTSVSTSAAEESATGAPRATPAPDQKVAYLTFDDGPSDRVTPRILKVLEEEGIHATFFIIGVNAERHPAVLRRIVTEGHTIGNHSYDHNMKTIYQSVGSLLASLRKADAAIEKVASVRPKLMRPPGWPTKRFKPAYYRAVCQAGYTVCGYNVSDYDTFTRDLDPDMIVNEIKRQTRQGKLKRAVILMHDSTEKDTTADALPEVIYFLRRSGYEFRVLSPEEVMSSPPID